MQKTTTLLASVATHWHTILSQRSTVPFLGRFHPLPPTPATQMLPLCLALGRVAPAASRTAAPPTLPLWRPRAAERRPGVAGGWPGLVRPSRDRPAPPVPLGGRCRCGRWREWPRSILRTRPGPRSTPGRWNAAVKPPGDGYGHGGRWYERRRSVPRRRSILRLRLGPCDCGSRTSAEPWRTVLQRLTTPAAAASA